MKRIILILAVVLAVLCIPLIAMQFSDQVQWSVSDFIIMGLVLSAVGLMYEFIARKSSNWPYRIAFGLSLAGIFLLFWVNAAVGIVGNENQPINLLFGLVILWVIGGAVIVRYRSSGMSLILFGASLIQFLIPIIGWLIWPAPNTSWSPGVAQVFMLNAFWVILFSFAGLLFRRTTQPN